MNPKQIVDEIRRLLGKYNGKEIDLYEALLEEAEGWQMRYDELEDEGEAE